MTENELTLLLERTTLIYSTFHVPDEETFSMWHELLKDVPFQVAVENLKHHMKTNEFAPKPKNFIGDYFDHKELSWHQYQQQEAEQSRLALQAYHENEDVKPMPDYVREKFERLAKKARGEHHES